VNWIGHEPRFRVYSQHIDQFVVLEITDPQRCEFEPDGTWRLRLTADETQALPRGGMCFTLEHRVSQGDYLLGIQGGVSCSDGKAGREPSQR
jgi:hypothetical protein